MNFAQFSYTTQLKILGNIVVRCISVQKWLRVVLYRSSCSPSFMHTCILRGVYDCQYHLTNWTIKSIHCMPMIWSVFQCCVVIYCDLTLLLFSYIHLFAFKAYFLQISEKWRLCWDSRGGWMILKANWNWWVLKSETEICVKIGVIFESERLSDRIEVRYLAPDTRIDAALDQTGYLVHDKIWASLLDDKLALQHLNENSLPETKLYPGSDKNTFLICSFWRKNC